MNAEQLLTLARKHGAYPLVNRYPRPDEDKICFTNEQLAAFHAEVVRGCVAECDRLAEQNKRLPEGKYIPPEICAEAIEGKYL